MNSSKDSIINFIKKYRVDDDKNFNHIFTDSNKIHKLYVNPDKYAVFILEYCELLNTDTQLSIAETKNDYTSIQLNLNFSFKELDTDNEDTVFIFPELIPSLIKIFQEIIEEYFDKIDDEQYTCVVLEANNYFFKNIAYKQIKLIFPLFVTETSLQNSFIKEKFLEIITINKLSRMLERESKNSWEDIIDFSDISGNNYYLYGSNRPIQDKNIKTLNIYAPPLFKTVYGKIEAEDLHSKTYDQKILENFEDLLSIKNHSFIKQNLLDLEKLEILDYEYLYPLIFSVNYYTTISRLREDVLEGLKLDNNYKHEMEEYEEDDVERETTINRAIRFINLLSKERFIKKNFWIDIGKCLFNITHGKIEGLNIWRNCTEKNNIAFLEQCKNYYYVFRFNNPFTINTLAWYARYDSPIQFNLWYGLWKRPSMLRAQTFITEADTAEILYRSSFLDYKYDSRSNKFYYFDKHLLKEDFKHSELKKYYLGEFKFEFEKTNLLLAQAIVSSNDNNEKDKLCELQKKLQTLMSRMKANAFMNNVIKFVEIHFQDSNLSVYLNANPELTGCEDCIIEICDKDCIYRDGKPEDYVSYSTKQYLRNNFSMEHELVQKCLSFMGQLYVDQDLRIFVFKIHASLLRRGNMDKVLIMCTGDKDAGKTIAKKLLETSLGEYFINFPNEVLTQSKRSSGGPNPEIARAAGKAGAAFAETSNNDIMKDDKLKGLVGGDAFYARECCSNGSDIKNTFKPFLFCNKPPTMDNTDDSVKDKILFVPHISLYSDNAPKDPLEQVRLKIFPKDKTFDAKIPSLSSAYLWLMVQHYKLYALEGLKNPKIVVDMTTEYWKNNDAYAIFIKEELENVYLPNSITLETPNGKLDNETELTLSAFYEKFSNWYKISYPGAKQPSRGTVKYTLEQKWGKSESGTWKGLRIKSS